MASVTSRRDAVADCFQDGVEQGFLAREVVVERAAADPGGGQYRLDRGAPVAVAGEQAGGHLDELAARGAALGRPLARGGLLRRGGLLFGHGTHLYLVFTSWRGAPSAGDEREAGEP